MYWTTHPSKRACGGTVTMIKQQGVKESTIQATIISVPLSKLGEINIGALYCPTRYTTGQSLQIYSQK